MSKVNSPLSFAYKFKKLIYVIVASISFFVSIWLSLALGISVMKGLLLEERVAELNRYLSTVWQYRSGWWQLYWEWFWQGWNNPIGIIAYLPVSIAVCILGIGGFSQCPSLPFTQLRQGRLAGVWHIRHMKFSKNGIVLGKNWQLICLNPSYSALCVAPPGKGKTAGVVIPTILNSPQQTLIIYDVKPELEHLTRKVRESCSSVYILDFVEGQGMYWNPLSTQLIPKDTQEKELYIARITESLVLSQAKGDGNLSYFMDKAKALLTGFMLYLVDAIEQKIPLIGWHETPSEASFPLLIQWLSVLPMEEKALEKVMQQLLHQAMIALSPRIIEDIGSWLKTEPRERATILSVLWRMLEPFRLEVIKRVMSTNSFRYEELRGIPQESPSFKPLTIYIKVKQEDAKLLGGVVALWLEMTMRWLLSHPAQPHEAKVCYLIDEFAQLPKLPAIFEVLALGRSQGINCLMVVQDIWQLERIYETVGLEEILGNTAAKIILGLNNERSAKRFSEMIGERSATIITQAEQIKGKMLTNFQQTREAIIPPERLLSLERGWQIVLYQGFMQFPLKLKTPFYFKEASMRRKIK